MNIRVVFHSHWGNTAKLAHAIAEVFGVAPEQIGKDAISFSEAVDLLFVGDGIYWAKPHKLTRDFFKQLDPALIKNAAVFATYGNQFKIGNDIREILQDKSINVVGEPFTCRGASVGTKNQGHPDETDLKNAKEFAQNIVSRLA